MPARKLARISLLAGALLFSTPLAAGAATSGGVAITPVSYTHLTLPTKA